MRVVVLSSTDVGRRSIHEGLLKVAECQVTGIVTTPPVIEISHTSGPMEIRTHASFDEVAARAGCRVYCFDRRPQVADYAAVLEQTRPDAIFALGWYYKVPGAIRARAPRGCLGIHASLLPKYRGGAPLVWAIINGERETGVTLFHLEDQMDAGDIVGQLAFDIEAEDTCAEVIGRAVDASVTLLRREVPRLADGTAPRLVQRHHEATVCPQRTPEDGAIDWSWTAVRVHDFVRAQTRPYSGAFTCRDGERVHIWRASPAASSSRDPRSPGEFRVERERLRVTCGAGVLDVHELAVNGTSCAPDEFALATGMVEGAFGPC